MLSRPIFDTHAHYCSGAFSPDRDAVLQSLPEYGVVGVVEQSTDSADAAECVALAHQYPFVWAAVGIHPESLLPAGSCPDTMLAATVTVYHGDWAAELRDMAPLLEDPRVVAVGECGLDHHWPIPAEAQYALFEAQLRLARELEKPIVVHDREAHAEVYELLRRYQPRGILHCYSGSAEDAVWVAEQGMYIGFGGACTFPGAKRAAKAIAALPLDRIVLETDCPYQAPQPWRRQRCHSGMISAVGEQIAAIKGLSPEEVFAATAQNARDVYGVA